MESTIHSLERIVAVFNTEDVFDVDVLFAAEYVDHQKPAGLDLDGPEELK